MHLVISLGKTEYNSLLCFPSLDYVFHHDRFCVAGMLVVLCRPCRGQLIVSLRCCVLVYIAGRQKVLNAACHSVVVLICLNGVNL